MSTKPFVVYREDPHSEPTAFPIEGRTIAQVDRVLDGIDWCLIRAKSVFDAIYKYPKHEPLRGFWRSPRSAIVHLQNS
jgi:hypothetical protein